LTSISIPESVVFIGNVAFANNRLTSIFIPDSVTFIGSAAFDGNPLISITIGANVRFGDWADILGNDARFNEAYNNADRQAGTYIRPNTNSTIWTRR